MGRYTEKNLIRYEQAIQLHFDTTFQIAWLTLKNYGLVFHRWPWSHQYDEVKEIIIGIPAGAFTSDEAAAFKVLYPACSLRPLQVKNAQADASGPISISAMLDVVDIIAFQTHVTGQAQTYSQGGNAWNHQNQVNLRTSYTPVALFQLLQSAFVAIGIEQPTFNSSFSSRGVRVNTLEKLNGTLGNRRIPGASWIAEQIKKNVGNRTGLIAYLPMPALIIEEQRTAVTETDRPYLTNNQDMRHIPPLGCPSNLPVSIGKDRKTSKTEIYNCSSLLDEIDKDRESNENVFVEKNIDRKNLLDRKKFPNGAAYLHRHVDRIDCYGFRGDTRDPSELKMAQGFLPGVTRSDIGVRDYAAQKKLIELVMNDKSDVGGVRYRQLLKDLDVLTLGVYTVEAAFKGYISTTKSTAIAKCLAGKYADKSKPFQSNYCYAVRCKDGFHLSTECFENRTWKRETDAPNAMTHYAEQEVAVPGAIFWSNVVGMRVIRADPTGRYFSGPVFLHEGLRSDFWTKAGEFDGGKMADDGAFDELFELLSGKSQNKGFEIEYSYPQAPFDCPDSLILWRNNTNYSTLDFK